MGKKLPRKPVPKALLALSNGKLCCKLCEEENNLDNLERHHKDFLGRNYRGFVGSPYDSALIETLCSFCHFKKHFIANKVMKILKNGKSINAFNVLITEKVQKVIPLIRPSEIKKCLKDLETYGFIKITDKKYDRVKITKKGKQHLPHFIAYNHVKEKEFQERMTSQGWIFIDWENYKNIRFLLGDLQREYFPAGVIIKEERQKIKQFLNA